MLRFNSALGAALVVMALAAGASAQEFPGKRVRPQHLADNWQGSPEAYLTEARVVLRSFEIDSSNGTMRISGRLWSDFEVENGHGSPAGQLMGLEVDVGLYEVSSDVDDKLGALVPTQELKCKITATEQAGDINLGVANFSFKELTKPLPPGVYRLVCKLILNKQSDAAKAAMMWVRDLYGVMPLYDANGQPTGESYQVYGSKDHKPAWKDMTENEVCVSKGTMFLGNTLVSGGIKLVTSGGGQNVLYRDPSFEIYKNLAFIATQRAQIDTEYEGLKQSPKMAPGESKADYEKRIKASHDQSIKLVDMLVARAGGKADASEDKAYNKMLAGMTTLRGALIAFEDDLNLKYWNVLDVFYYNFHSINKAGYNCSQAIDKGNNNLDREEREKRLDEMKDPAKKSARDAKREENFRYIPEPIKKAAFEFARRSEETSEFDSASFTRKQGKEVMLDSAKWSEFRKKFLADFREKSKAALATIDLSQNYAIQKWGDMFKQVLEVRDSIMIHVYCYEYYLRMVPVEKEIAKDPKANAGLRAQYDKEIVDGWTTEAGDQIKELLPLFAPAKGAPSAIFGRFESAYKQAKHLLDMPDFAYRYKLNIDKQVVPPPRRWKQG